MTPFKIEPSGSYVQLIYVDAVSESVQQELRSDTDAFECSYDSDGKLFMQFGAMRFENPEPTDFEINGSPVTDAADFISKLNALFTGGGGGSSLFPTTGTGTATGDVTADLNGHKLIANTENYPIPLFQIDATEDNQNINLGGFSDFEDGMYAQFQSMVQVEGESFTIQTFVGVFKVNGSTANISAVLTSESDAIMTYTADNHVFVGLGDFADDAAAAIGGVPINGLYHTSGTVKIRLS